MKLWGGRFSKDTAAIVDNFNASIEFDQKLYKQDITGSIAHAKMLAHAGIISQEESLQIAQCLQGILADIEAGNVEFKVSLEDIHMNIETLLIERIGDTGKKLHTARSRNDQVAVDIRLYTRDEITPICELLKNLLTSLLALGEEHVDTIMPGYTHLQRAQPITLGYHLTAYFQMFRRDYERLMDCYKRVNVMPLGSGALAGVTYAIDRNFLARELDFDRITENGLDAVSDRDFVIEFISCSSLIMMHLSRFCEELVLWSSQEFQFIEMDDAYSTGSSIMPQKKNPDIAELIRGKTGRVYGNLLTILTIMKSLPLAYNKDMQEDKPPLFDTVETVKICLEIFTPMLNSIVFKKDKMRKAVGAGFMNATDVADYLVKKSVPFRSSHEIVGKMVLYCIQSEKTIEDLSLEEFASFSPVFSQDILQEIKTEKCVQSKISWGSTNTENVLKVLNLGKEYLSKI